MKTPPKKKCHKTALKKPLKEKQILHQREKHISAILQ